MGSHQKKPIQVLEHRLRLAYAGELGAAKAYAGHSLSVADPQQAQDIRKIMGEELEHRAEVGRMLRELGAQPSRLRDAAFWCIGNCIAASCFVGGWFAPMYGAGRLEWRNIWEYELAARLARDAGHKEWVEPLLAMAEVEWDHERFFHDHVRSHWLHDRVGSWPAPPPREEIRASFARGEPARHPVRAARERRRVARRPAPGG